MKHEQSLAGGLFNTLTQVSPLGHLSIVQRILTDVDQIGTSIGLALSSIILDKTMARKTRELTNAGGMTEREVSKAALLAAYRAVQWLNFAFVMVGEYSVCFLVLVGA